MKNKAIVTLTTIAAVLTGCAAPLISEGEIEVIKDSVESDSETSINESSSESSSLKEESSVTSTDEPVFEITRSDLYMSVYHELVDDFGMSEDDLVSFLDETGYDFESDFVDGFYHVYYISDPDREGMRLFLNCSCNGEYEGDTSGDYIFTDMTYQDSNGHEEYIQFNSPYWMDDYEYDTWCYARITSKDGNASNLTTIDFDSLDEMEKYFFIME